MLYKIFLPLTALLWVFHASGQPIMLDLNVRKEALNYYRKLHTESSCALPQSRVIPLQQIYPNPSAVYATSCVVLHQCAYDTGCCPPSEVCAVKDSVEITIPILYANPPGKVQPMTFTNHTSCQCVKMKPGDSNSA